MSNTPDEKLREILGEDDWRYTEKPSKIQALITKAKIDELGNIELAPVGETRIHVQGDGDKAGDFVTIRERLTQLKENNNER